VIIILLWKHSETFRDIVLGVWEAIKTAAMAVATWFTSSFLPALQAVWDAIVNAVKIAFAIVATVITTYINIWKTIILGALNYIKTMWSAIWWALGPIVKAVFGLIAAIIKLAWTIIKGVVILNARYIKAVIVGTWNAIKAVTSAVWGAIKAVFTAVWGFIGPYVKTAVNAIKGAVESAWNAVKSKTTEIWNGLKSIVSGAIDSVMTLVNGIKARVTGAFSGAINWLTGAGKDIIQGLIDGIVGMIDDVTGAIGKVTSVISDHLPGSPVKEGPLRVLNRGYAGKQIVEMVIAGIDKMEQPTRQALDQAVPSPFDVWGKGRGWNITKEMAGQAAKSRARDNHAPNGPWGINNWEPKGTVKPKEPEKKGDVIRIAGNLELANGRAYITGIAEDVVDRNDATNSRRG
jgi:phage-related protein